jgi:hypothetical protein
VPELSSIDLEPEGGRTDRTAIRALAVHDSFEEWLADR